MQLPDFNNTCVMVAGDLMLDRYWYGGTSRISPEAPVPVVHVKRTEDRPGGAANVALNLAALGCRVTLLGYAGRDATADALENTLAERGIDCRFDRFEAVETITKLRVVSRQQQLLRMDFESGFHGCPATPLVENFRGCLSASAVVVLSDYGKGTLSEPQALIELARAVGVPILIDPKGHDFAKYRGATLITPNLAEFERVVGPCADESALIAKGEALRADLDLAALLVTRGEHGMTLLQKDRPALTLAARAKEVFDVTGAGDTVIGVLAAALAAGSELAEATALANLAAGIVVGKLGTATVSTTELTEVLRGQRARRHGVLDEPALLAEVSAARRLGERIVLTNGCFDLLHRGHIEYLREARSLGDRLVVLVNGDASVRRLKGPERPINSVAERMAVLAALECVDWVCAFDEDTPERLICRIVPDLLVKGGDYPDVRAIAGHDCVVGAGGEVRTLQFLEGYSTTRLIKSLQGQ